LIASWKEERLATAAKLAAQFALPRFGLPSLAGPYYSGFEPEE